MIVFVESNVGRLEISVNDTFTVRVVQRGRECSNKTSYIIDVSMSKEKKLVTASIKHPRKDTRSRFSV